MSLTVEQKTNMEGFVKPGELVDIRAGANLSLHDRRVFNVLIEHAWPEIAQDRTHRIPMAKLRGRHKGRERVSESIKALMTSLVEVPTILEGQPAIAAMQLLGPTTRTIDEESPNALLLYKFPDDLRKIIQDSHYWGRIKGYVMFAFSSKYALALYEAVCLRANLRIDSQELEVEELRNLLGVEKGQYPGFPQLKQKVLAPAVMEVNALSDFTVEIDVIREGGLLRGKLAGFRLHWEKKEREAWHQVLKELHQPRIGRRARIEGRVDKIGMIV